MALGYDGKLYILAFDHRGSFQKKMFGIEGDPTPEQIETISDAKRLVFEGIQHLREADFPGRPEQGITAFDSPMARHKPFLAKLFEDIGDKCPAQVKAVGNFPGAAALGVPVQIAEHEDSVIDFSRQ